MASLRFLRVMKGGRRGAQDDGAARKREARMVPTSRADARGFGPWRRRREDVKERATTGREEEEKEEEGDGRKRGAGPPGSPLRLRAIQTLSPKILATRRTSALSID